MTLRARLTLWYAATLVVVVAIATGLLWSQLEAQLTRSLEENLRLHAADLRAVVERGDGLTPLIRERERPGTWAVIFSADGGIVATDGSAPSPLAEPPEGSSTTVLPGSSVPVALVRLPLAESRALVVGTSLAGVQTDTERLALLVFTVGLGAIVLGLAGGAFVAGRALAPIRRLTRAAARLDPADLDARLPIPAPQDELRSLAVAFDRLLDRVAAAVARERSFISGAAHDLRTPVSRLRLRLELAATSTDDPAELRAALVAAAADARRLGDLADGLLRLAEVEAGSSGPAAPPAWLIEVLMDVLHEAGHEAAARDVTIDLQLDDPEAQAFVDPVRTGQALANLVRNAVTATPPGSTVVVAAVPAPEADGDAALPGRPGRPAGAARPGRPARDGRQGFGRRGVPDDPARPSLLVTVTDAGPGIPVELRRDLFQPFGARRRADDGTVHGLGLAIAAAAVTAQGGEIGYRDAVGGGACLWFTVPRLDEPAA